MYTSILRILTTRGMFISIECDILIHLCSLPIPRQKQFGTIHLSDNAVRRPAVTRVVCSVCVCVGGGGIVYGFVTSCRASVSRQMHRSKHNHHMFKELSEGFSKRHTREESFSAQVAFAGQAMQNQKNIIYSTIIYSVGWLEM